MRIFAEQCTTLKNNSIHFINQIFLTQSKLVSLYFNEDEFFKTIRALSIHKTHGRDDIPIRMINPF